MENFTPKQSKEEIKTNIDFLQSNLDLDREELEAFNLRLKYIENCKDEFFLPIKPQAEFEEGEEYVEGIKKLSIISIKRRISTLTAEIIGKEIHLNLLKAKLEAN